MRKTLAIIHVDNIFDKAICFFKCLRSVTILGKTGCYSYKNRNIHENHENGLFRG